MNPKPARSSTTPLNFVELHQGLLVALTAALVVRVYELGEWWLNPDEGIYYSILTRESFSGFWSEVASNAHPPLYYLLLRGMGAIAWDFVWFRALTVLCGLAAVWAAWAVARSLAGSGARGTAAGLIAASTMALAPGAIELSQVMRPYMLQVALLSGALLFLLRYLEGSRAPGLDPDGAGAAAVPEERAHGHGRDLVAYLLLVLLALLTHYSSMLALGAFGLVVVHDGLTHGTGRRAWRRVFAAHALPGLVLGLVYLVHLRPLMSSALADEALDGWLNPYMIDAPRDAWLAFLGFQHFLAQRWLHGFTALATLATLAVSALAKPSPRDSVDVRRPAVLIASGFLIAIAAASLGIYPLGATRHSAWLLVFVVPGLGWLGAHVLSRTGRNPLVWGGALSLLLIMSGPIGDALGGQQVPWAPDERILREESLTQVVDVLDPSASPELMVMSAQTFYLLLPFYPVEREAEVRSADGHLFHFRLGSRHVLVSESWDFTAGSDKALRSDLAGTLSAAAQAFPELSLDQTAQAVLLIGGWRPPLVDRLVAASAEGARPFLVSSRSVPGFYAFLIDVPAVREAFGQQ